MNLKYIKVSLYEISYKKNEIFHDIPFHDIQMYLYNIIGYKQYFWRVFRSCIFSHDSPTILKTNIKQPNNVIYLSFWVKS